MNLRELTETLSKRDEELRIHQIELEAQHHELLAAHAALALSRDQYRSLCSNAPVGFLTVDERGTILTINRTAADLCGMERGELLGVAFPRFLREDDYQYLYKLQKTTGRPNTWQGVDVRIESTDVLVTPVHLFCSIAEDLSTYNLCLTVIDLVWQP